LASNLALSYNLAAHQQQAVVVAILENTTAYNDACEKRTQKSRSLKRLFSCSHARFTLWLIHVPRHILGVLTVIININGVDLRVVTVKMPCIQCFAVMGSGRVVIRCHDILLCADHLMIAKITILTMNILTFLLFITLHLALPLAY
tara:strand:+ start:284 stop:721 length:438 start_codon:yes stop_codon:yes gene_type:complete